MQRGHRQNNLLAKVGVDSQLMLERILDHIFVFNCCSIIQDHLEKIEELDSDQKISALWHNLKPRLKDANDVRNHFEHIVRDIINAKVFKYGNVNGDEIDFSFKQFNAKEALEVACEAYEGLLQILVQRPFKPPASYR